MALYEPTLQLYQEIGFPALLKGGQDKKLVGYFQSDTGTINQLLHSGSSMMTPTGERIGGSVREQGIRPRLRPKVSSPAYDPGGKATPGGTVGTAEIANVPPSPGARVPARGRPSDDPRHSQPCPFRARAQGLSVRERRMSLCANSATVNVLDLRPGGLSSHGLDHSSSRRDPRRRCGGVLAPDRGG